jgi:LPXTG-motif cell wall-anchored protein
VTTAPGGVGGAELPVTGARIGLLAGVAFALLLLGGALLALTRRRTMFDGLHGDGPSHR